MTEISRVWAYTPLKNIEKVKKYLLILYFSSYFTPLRN